MTKDVANAKRKRGRAIASWILDPLLRFDPMLLNSAFTYQDNETALTKAAMCSDSFAWELIRRGANVNVVSRGFTVLWECIENGKDCDLLRAVLTASSQKTITSVTPVDKTPPIMTALYRLQQHCMRGESSVYRAQFARDQILVLLEFTHGDGSGIQVERPDKHGVTASKYIANDIMPRVFGLCLDNEEQEPEIQEIVNSVVYEFEKARARVALWRAGYDSTVYASVGLRFQIPVLLALIKEYVIVCLFAC
jgi:hypothetical protein